METFDVSIYKYNLLQDLFNNQDIVDGIDSQSSDYIKGENDSLINNNLFTYLRVPSTQTKADSYICLAVSMPNINNNNTSFVDMRITVRVLVHQDRQIMKGKSANRMDYLAKKVSEMLDGQLKYGYGKLVITSDIEDILNENYMYRDINLRTVDLKPSAANKVGRF